MKIEFDPAMNLDGRYEDMIGNVYQVRGGFGARNGHMHVIIAATQKISRGLSHSGYTTVTVDCDGDIIGANHYACHYFDEKVPIAKVDGLENLSLLMRSL